ncbi:MAG: hypothetical protein GY703_07125 [Gammaproteobacteria bacterium]|nr:hypothetical protein [Gammaproteobacteria bacterium]
MQSSILQLLVIPPGYLQVDSPERTASGMERLFPECSSCSVYPSYRNSVLVLISLFGRPLELGITSL